MQCTVLNSCAENCAHELQSPLTFFHILSFKSDRPIFTVHAYFCECRLNICCSLIKRCINKWSYVFLFRLGSPHNMIGMTEFRCISITLLLFPWLINPVKHLNHVQIMMQYAPLIIIEAIICTLTHTALATICSFGIRYRKKTKCVNTNILYGFGSN